MQAPDRPRRPIRRMQRTRGSCRARPRTTSQVPSGELSSTKTTSQGMPASVASSRRYSTVTLSRSLKVGTTTESCGKPAACDGVSGPGLMASFMSGQRISAAAGRCQGRHWNVTLGGENGPKQAPKMPTTTNRGRAYIRRSQTIHGRPSAGALKRQRRRYELDRDAEGVPQGQLRPASSINWALPGSPAPAAPARRAPAVRRAGWTRPVWRGFPNCPIGP